MVEKIFVAEELTDSTPVDSDLFDLLRYDSSPVVVSLAIGCTSSSGTANNIVTVRLMISPNWYEDPDNATWIPAPANLMKRISLLCGEDHDVGILDSGDEFEVSRVLDPTRVRAKLTATRQATPAGTNTITINGWVN